MSEPDLARTATRRHLHCPGRPAAADPRVVAARRGADRHL